ncbi:MAG: PH domain-containing protein [Peptostreptococcaceae bacterium]|nr:PH domain-containing protein [Peptostreptococcaceae bacterium]
MEYRALNKKAINCMRMTALIGTVVLIIISIVFVILLRDVIWLMIVLGVLLTLNVISVIVVPIIRYKRYKYRITDDEIDVIEGFLWVKRDIVPIERLHKIEIAQGPIDRMYKLAKVQVTTAGGDVTIRFLERDVADSIADTLKARINNIVRKENVEDADDKGKVQMPS